MPVTLCTIAREQPYSSADQLLLACGPRARSMAQPSRLPDSIRQSAGLIWRAHDRNNYYAAVLDAREGRVRLLRMLDGRPHEIASAAAPIEVEFQRQSPSRERGWYVWRVESVDDRLQVWVGDQRRSPPATPRCHGPVVSG